MDLKREKILKKFEKENENKDKNMKTIGLIGGMSWESTVDYYKYLNEGIKEILGGLNSLRFFYIHIILARLRLCNTLKIGMDLLKTW